MEVVTDLQRAHPDRDIAVIVPELVGDRWYHYLLHNQTAAFIKAYLLLQRLPARRRDQRAVVHRGMR